MTDATPSEQARNDDRIEPQSTTERLELLEHVQTILEPIMVGLGFVFLGLLLLDYSGILTDPRHGFWLSRSLTVIWAVFVVEFLVRLVIAPSKRRFFMSNWLSAASLALPFLRPIRALRALRAMRSLSLLRLLGGVNRGMRVLRRVIGGNTIAYLVSLTLVVTLFSAAGVWFFERNTEDASVKSFGDAVWWSAAMVTTINNELYAVSPEARVLAILLRIYAVSIFGFITATIARYLIDREMARSSREGDAGQSVALRLQEVERELAALRQALLRTAALDAPSEAASSSASPVRPDRDRDEDRQQ